MAWYLLRTGENDYRIIEADSAIQAIERDVNLGVDAKKFEVWTLRSGEPRTYEVSTETITTIKAVT